MSSWLSPQLDEFITKAHKWASLLSIHKVDELKLQSP